MTRLYLVAVVALGGCLIGGGTRTVSAVELRAGVVGVDPVRLDARLREAIERGEVWPGASEAEVYLARGEPRLWWNTRVGDNACRVFVHHGADPARADLAVTTCGGAVVQTRAIEPALPCWRLAEVGPRIAAAVDYFERRPLDVQWQIVIGLLHRGQAEQDVMLAFGRPYSRGFDEREDGKRAEKLAFLDASGDAYGLSVTVIDDRVAGWVMPAERTLTAEAQQRRLDAMEKRLMDKLNALERLAIKQHQESVRLFGEVMAKPDEMLRQLSTIDARPPEPAAPPVRPPIANEPPPPRPRDTSTTITTTTTHVPAPPDPFAKRNQCQRACQTSYDQRTKQCRERWNDDGCGTNESCRYAVAKSFADCAHSRFFVECSKACD